MKKLFYILFLSLSIFITGCSQNKITLKTESEEISINVKNDLELIEEIIPGVDQYSFISDEESNTTEYLIHVKDENGKASSSELILNLMEKNLGIEFPDSVKEDDFIYYLNNYAPENVKWIKNDIESKNEYVYLGDEDCIDDNEYLQVMLATLENTIGNFDDALKEDIALLIDYGYFEELIKAHNAVGKLDANNIALIKWGYFEQLIEMYEHGENSKFVLVENQYRSAINRFDKETLGYLDKDLPNNGFELADDIVGLSEKLEKFEVDVKEGQYLTFISNSGPLDNNFRLYLKSDDGNKYKIELISENGSYIYKTTEPFKNDTKLTLTIRQHRSLDLSYSIFTY